jgi:lysophospholipase L1-like esterase
MEAERRAPLPEDRAGVLADRNGDGLIVVGCLGDSNTQIIPLRPRNWCEMLRDLMPEHGFATVNRGEGGATAVSEGSMIHAADHLDYALAYDRVDAVVMAYGTNDLLIARASPEEVVAAYRSFRTRAHAAGVDFFVALASPLLRELDSSGTGVEILNAEIAKAFHEKEIIDFFSDMQPDDYEDEIHLRDSGQAKRAAAAWKVLKAASGGP